MSVRLYFVSKAERCLSHIGLCCHSSRSESPWTLWVIPWYTGNGSVVSTPRRNYTTSLTDLGDLLQGIGLNTSEAQTMLEIERTVCACRKREDERTGRGDGVCCWLGARGVMENAAVLQSLRCVLPLCCACCNVACMPGVRVMGGFVVGVLCVLCEVSLALHTRITKLLACRGIPCTRNFLITLPPPFAVI